MSPDSNAVLSWEIKFVIDLHVERTVPGINISDGAIHSISLRRVGVGRKLLSRCLIGLFCAKALRIAEKKSLIAGQAVKVQFVWTDFGDDRAQWEQAFSYDEGQTWDTNWVMSMTRAA